MSKLVSHYATNRDQVGFCRQVITRHSCLSPRNLSLSLSALPRQSNDKSSDSPNLLTFCPTKPFSIFQFPFARVRIMPSEARSINQRNEESIVQRANGQVRSLSEPPFPPSFSTGPDAFGQAAGSPCIVVTGPDRRANARALFGLSAAYVACAFSYLYLSIAIAIYRK